MEFTPKQVRNGADQGAEGHNTAVTDAGPATSLPIGTAVAAGNNMADHGHDWFDSPAGSGSGGHMVGPDGPMFEWDSGLAINDVEGGGSS
jgi:hypothetical protein